MADNCLKIPPLVIQCQRAIDQFDLLEFHFFKQPRFTKLKNPVALAFCIARDEQGRLFQINGFHPHLTTE